MVTGDAATPPPPGEHTGATPTGPENDQERPSPSRVERVAGGLGRGEWVKIIAVIVAGLALAAALLFVLPALQVKASDYHCPLPLPTATSSEDVPSLSSSCRAPGAGSDTTDQQALDTARSAARAPYGVLSAALLAGAAAVVGVIVNSHNARLTRDTINATLDANDATQLRDATTADLTRAGQYTDRYIKAIGLINDDKLNARLGGLYALEQLAKEAPLTYHATIVDVLSAYIRERAPWPPLTPTTGSASPRPRSQRRVATGHREPATTPQEQPARPALDIQTALTILGRRNPTHTTPNGQHHDLEDHPLNLSQTQLEGADLRGAHLEGANLRGAHLEGAYLDEESHLEGAALSEAHLENSYLWGAHLENSYLDEAHLEGAILRGAHLEGAVLWGAHLEGADLDEAYLEGSSLNEAHLEGASLFEAHLKDAGLRAAHLEVANLVGANLKGAYLGEAHLEGADLSVTNLSQEQLAGAVVDDETKLPEHLHR